jgi:hypothetical protein
MQASLHAVTKRNPEIEILDGDAGVEHERLHGEQPGGAVHASCNWTGCEHEQSDR